VVQKSCSGKVNGWRGSKIEDDGHPMTIYVLHCRQVAGEVDVLRAKGERVDNLGERNGREKSIVQKRATGERFRQP
jgi:hypothetical protein